MGGPRAAWAVALLSIVVGCAAPVTSTPSVAPSPAPSLDPSPARTAAVATAAAPPSSPAASPPRAGVLRSTLAQGLAPRPCADRPLRRSPVAVEHISTIGPFRSLVPPGHVFPTPHMYFYVKSDATPLVAPADLTITSVAPRVQPAPGGRERSDHTLTFAVCDGYEGYFHHVIALTHPALVKAFAEKPCTPTGTPQNRTCNSDIRVEIKDGEQIGTVGDTATRTLGVDLGVRDYRSQGWRDTFARPERYCGSPSGPFNLYDHCYAACPLDQMADAARAPLLGLVMNLTRTLTRAEEPRCGPLAADLPGTAQGRWVSPGQPVPNEERHIYLGPNEYTSQYEEFSVGGSIPGVTGNAYLFTPESAGPARRRFSQVTDETVVCYDGLSIGDVGARAQRADFALLIQLRERGTKLAVERREGACGPGPWSIGQRAFVFER